MNFPKFSESKGILKIGRSEVCVWGGGAEGRTFNSRLSVYINSGVFNSREFKNGLHFSFQSNPIPANDHHFHLRVPPTPTRVSSGGGGLVCTRGGIPPKIMCYVNSEVFNSRKLKKYHFSC